MPSWTWRKTFFETLWKRDKMLGNQYFHSIFNMVCVLSETEIINELHTILLASVNAFNMLDLNFFNPLPNKPLFLHVCSRSPLKTLRKGEIARNNQFLLFPKCFLSLWRTFCHIVHENRELSSLSVWKRLKFTVWEKFNYRRLNLSNTNIKELLKS